MTLTHHNASQGNECRSPEAELFGAETGSDNDITARLKLAVGLEPHPAAKVVDDQCLMGLGKPQLKGQPGVLD